MVFIFKTTVLPKSVKIMVDPFHLLDDLTKIIYSEQFENFVGLKLKDLRKTQGKNDHVILILNDAKVFANFVMCYAEQEEDDFVFEHNEEFSIIVNSSPQWFAFDDVDRALKIGKKKAFKSQDMTGYLEQKQNNKALSII